MLHSRSVCLLALMLIGLLAGMAAAQDTQPPLPPPVEPDPDVKPRPDKDAERAEAERDAPEPRLDGSVEVTRNVPYLSVPGVAAGQLSLDIYAPAGGEKRPVVVYVHGGGWRTGDKSRVALKPRLFCGAGWVFVSVNYRLLPAGKHPANVRDVAAALAWVRQHIAQYRGDPGCILLTGHSAGAHLAALVATDERHLRHYNCDLSLLRAVVPLDTASYDITWQVENDRGDRGDDEDGRAGRAGTMRERMERSVGDEAARRDASPITHVQSGRTYPPFLLVYAGTRRDSPVASQAFAERLREVGGTAGTFSAAGKNHGAVNQDLGKPDDPMTAAVMAFFRQAIGDAAKPPTEGGNADDGDAGQPGEAHPDRPAPERPRLRDVLRTLDLTAGQAFMVAQLMREYRGRYGTDEFQRQLRVLLTAEQWKQVEAALGGE